MTDERFLDIREKVCSFEFTKSSEKQELESFGKILSDEIERYHTIYNKLNKEDILSLKLTKGVKNKLTDMMSLLYKVEKLKNIAKT